MIFVYITNPNKKTALKIANELLKQRLIGCANIFPIESLYWWKGKIVKDKEYVLIAKTLEKNYKKVKEIVEKIHPYSVPCILKIKIDKVNEKYLKWLKEVVKI
ncbi:MAG: divalent-cation tolerance protein CutA [Candidatus Parcubacteria bacterium]|nr:MAG: divalent-cation tolerance protein CutA [Candidatus Parcubacteria bacterium]